MADPEDRPPREPLRDHFKRSVLAMTPEDAESLRQLIKIEPELTRLIEGKRAWAVVLETLKKIATWLAIMSGGLFAARQLMEWLHK
ncbi:hypothetical protein NPA31_007075 [Aurantimonas sp. MSK8Z-1]|uniref:hypothetical protein n=1 Tax=Mangrovibrevibacter kandeliae TaxID=2968473 RepID=UPI002118D7DD|nr:hypothetical protein [Aurantimonas sp. MSK8Z-1]MCW4114723.1 hypothetical protein [Aurantimonas sp. MSK8Z-1]